MVEMIWRPPARRDQMIEPPRRTREAFEALEKGAEEDFMVFS
jgi:hypothetical protein